MTPVVLELLVVVAAIVVSATVSVWVGKTAELALARMRARWPETIPA